MEEVGSGLLSSAGISISSSAPSKSTPPIPIPSPAPNKEEQGTSPPSSGQVTSTSPSSVGRSITSALAAAMPSFKGGFLRSSTPTGLGLEGAHEGPSTDQARQTAGTEKSAKSSQDVDPPSAAIRLSKQVAGDEASVTIPSSAPAPANQPSSTVSASTSYLPSPASITSFFSSGSKPKSTTPAASTPLQSTTPPPTESANHAPISTTSSRAPAKETNNPLTEASPSSPPVEVPDSAPPQSSTSEPTVSVGNPSSTKSVSPAPSAPPTSSLTALMNAAAPYLAPSSRKPSKPAVPTGVGPAERPSSLPQSDKSQGARSSVKDGVTPASGAPSRSSTSETKQTAIEAPIDADVTSTPVSSAADSAPPSSPNGDSASPSALVVSPGALPQAAPPSSSPQGDPSSASPQPPQPATSPSDDLSHPSEGPQPASSAEKCPPSTSQVPQPVSSAQIIPPNTSQNPQPGTSAQETPPGAPPLAPQPVASAQGTSPGTSSQAPQPTASARGTSPGTGLQAPEPAPSAQATSPGTSYLSLPSFLPSWSTITAQLPSIPSTPFTSKETEAIPGTRALNSGGGAGSSSGAVTDSGFGPKSDSGQRPVPSTRGAVSESGVPSQPSQSSESSGFFPSTSARTGPPSAFVPSSSEATTKQGEGVSEPGGKEQAAPRPELDPPGAAAADNIAAGIAGVFGPVTREADKQVEAALRSQEKLALSIDRLTKGLDKLLEESPQPLVAQQAARLAHIRKRAQSLASTLKVIQGRIDSMNWALDRKSLRTPFSRARSATAPNSPHSYQPGATPFEQIRQQVAESRAVSGRRDHPQLPTSWRPDPSGSTGMVANLGSATSSSRGGEMADLSRVAQARSSSKSPDKGHRRAMSTM